MAVTSLDKKADEVIARLEVIQFSLANDMRFRQKIIEIMRNKSYSEYKDPLRQYLIETLKSHRPNDITRIVHVVDYEIKILDPMSKPLVKLPPTPLGDTKKNKPQQKTASGTAQYHVELGLFSKRNTPAKTNETSPKHTLAKKKPA